MKQQVPSNSQSIPCFQESVYSAGPLEDQEGSRGIERWMRCPTPPISVRLVGNSINRETTTKTREQRVRGKIEAFESVLFSGS
ncbi:hypothetical protein F5Y02DRAFT_389325 [Annulohypoxylon stygium]|nr:hypothetical protein F5Y02DRAFT_389325 [Annulohypoxylon stygium]